MTSVSIIDTGLSPNTTYQYKIQAYDASNNASDFFTTVAGTTLPEGTATNQDINLPTDALDFTQTNGDDFVTANADTMTIGDANVYMLADEIALYICASITDTDIRASGTADASTLYQDDSIEIYFFPQFNTDYRFVFSANDTYAD